MNDNLNCFDNYILTLGVSMEERQELKEAATDIIDIFRKKGLSHNQAAIALECTKALMNDLPI